MNGGAADTGLAIGATTGGAVVGVAVVLVVGAAVVEVVVLEVWAGPTVTVTGPRLGAFSAKGH